MHENTDDTIPHAAAAAAARAVRDADVSDVVLGDTVVSPAVLGGGAPQPDTVPTTPALPAALRPHHRIRVGGGDPIELDRPVHIGRRPRGARVPSPTSPTLVTVASPEGGISSTHLEVREQGLAVVVRDMRTLNGSEVRIPGAPVRTLVGGASVVVTPGTRIELGEGAVVEILEPARPAPREERMP